MFIAVGTNHKYSPVSFRDRISLRRTKLRDALFFLTQDSPLKGAWILSTCNRFEIYASAEGEAQGVEAIEFFLRRYFEMTACDIAPYLYRYKGVDAFRHLLSVACGIDSLIVGETQILGQVKECFSESLIAGCVNRELESIFRAAVGFAKKIQRSTRLSEGHVSVGSVAIDFLKGKFGSLRGKTVLLLGVGKVTGLVLRYLKDEHPDLIFVSSRTFDKAKAMAEAVGGNAVRYETLAHHLREADIIITATASPGFVIKYEIVRGVIKERAKPLCIVDLAVPRDVDPRIRRLDGVDLFYLEDLKGVIRNNLAKRAGEAEKAAEMIENESGVLWKKSIDWERDPVLSR